MAPRDAAYYMAKLLSIGTKANVIGVNLGGAGEVPGYVNINNGIDSRLPGAIANLITDRAENITRHCQPNSVDHVTANNIVPGTVNWSAVAPGVFRVLRLGGLVSLAEFGGGYDKGENIKQALEAAGFVEVAILSGTVVVAEK